ncbi:MAG TPA: hypothetical protein VIK13_18640 [Candidatus Limnocylindrales bacterium]
MGTSLSAYRSLPGFEIVEPGLDDLARGRLTVSALVLTVCRERLAEVGITVPPVDEDPVDALHNALEEEVGDDAHARYNALLGRMLSFLDGAWRVRA